MIIFFPKLNNSDDRLLMYGNTSLLINAFKKIRKKYKKLLKKEIIRWKISDNRNLKFRRKKKSISNEYYISSDDIIIYLFLIILLISQKYVIDEIFF